MPRVDVVVDCPVRKSFRVEQAAGMFDVPLEEKLREEFSVELPDQDEAWQIGAIVGPSGSGKTTIARKAYGPALYTGSKWPKAAAVVDGFGDLPIKQITQALTAVGFSSPPSWVKPYGVLSNGERFRCDLARALLSDRPLVAYDEFTSVVDRTVAKIGSAAVAKAIRKHKIGKLGRRFVAVTCHYDVLDWLQPDWVLDMASMRLARGRLQRPDVRLAVAPVHRSAWILFRRHHYLSGSLNKTATSFAAFWGETPVGFSAWMPRRSKTERAGDMREHRTVVLPDFQGIGIGNRLSDFCASIWAGLDRRAYSTTSHPAMIRHRSASANWRRLRIGMVNPSGPTGIAAQEMRKGFKQMSSLGRVTAGFQYVGPVMDRADAEPFLAAVPRTFCRDRIETEILTTILRWPGARVALIARRCGLSTSGAAGRLRGLITHGMVRRDGLGYLPTELLLAEGLRPAETGR